MRISALLISVIVFLLTSLSIVTCTGEASLATKAPMSIRVQSVPPKAIPKPSSSPGGRSGRSGGGRYSPSGK